jgi:hypothetical protein
LFLSLIKNHDESKKQGNLRTWLHDFLNKTLHISKQFQLSSAFSPRKEPHLSMEEEAELPPEPNLKMQRTIKNLYPCRKSKPISSFRPASSLVPIPPDVSTFDRLVSASKLKQLSHCTTSISVSSSFQPS